ncbi:MAG TPA: DinB family protein [Pyrinomonadaceae bacterium]
METKSVEEFLDYFEKVRGRTRRVVDCIPRERIDWTYREGKFTFADLVRHLAATERYMFAENAVRRPSRYPGHGRELAEGYDEVIQFMERMHAESLELFRTLGDDDLQLKCTTPGGAEITVWKWLRSMIEHEAHHRGQIYMMLSLIDVRTPPLYGLTSEDVLERSQR